MNLFTDNDQQWTCISPNNSVIVIFLNHKEYHIFFALLIAKKNKVDITECMAQENRKIGEANHKPKNKNG